MADKYLNKYRIPSTRLSSWDYSSNGAYFITICTAKRQNYFGEIINAEMHLSKIGEMANQCWLAIPEHFPFVLLDAFIVMPNHTHGIIIIDKPDNDGGDDVIVETGTGIRTTTNQTNPHPFSQPGEKHHIINDWFLQISGYQIL